MKRRGKVSFQVFGPWKKHNFKREQKLKKDRRAVKIYFKKKSYKQEKEKPMIDEAEKRCGLRSNFIMVN